MDITGDANVSRLFSLGTGLFAGGKTNQALDSLDNVSSTVRSLDNLDNVTDVTKTLDDVTDSTKAIDDLNGINNSANCTSGITDNINNSTVVRPSWRQSEIDAGKNFPDYEAQKSSINGEEVPYGTKGSVRPDYYKNGYSMLYDDIMKRTDNSVTILFKVE